MQKMRALVANEPRIYREFASEALARLRPLLVEVSCCAEAEDLEREVARLGSHLVICSRLTESVRERCPCWVVLYPEGEDRLFGGAGKDDLRGDGGADVMSGSSGEDRFSGGSGTDMATDYEAGQGDSRENTVETF